MEQKINKKETENPLAGSLSFLYQHFHHNCSAVYTKPPAEYRWNPEMKVFTRESYEPWETISQVERRHKSVCRRRMDKTLILTSYTSG